MAIVTKAPTAPITPVSNRPKIEPDNYKGVIYDDKNDPIDRLSAYVEGYTQTVNYYSAVRTADNDLAQLDENRDRQYQQYRKYENYEFKVDSPISHSYDQNTAVSTVRGSAVVPNYIIPNVNDYFIAESGRRMMGLFRITEVQPLSISRKPAFLVEYDLVAHTAGQKESLFDNLENKVIATYHYSKNRLIEGLSPILLTSTHNFIQNLTREADSITKFYMESFFNKEMWTITIPGQDDYIYDLFLTNYLLLLLDSNSHRYIKELQVLAIEGDDYVQQPTIWTALKERDYDILSYCNRTMGLLSPDEFNSNPYMFSGRYKLMNYYVYPTDVDYSIRGKHRACPYKVSELKLKETYNNRGIQVVQGTHIPLAKVGDDTLPIYPKFLEDSHYVFDAKFYSGEANSILEVLVRDYLKHKALDPCQLEVLIKYYKVLNRLEQYYYGPILLTLIYTYYHDASN